MIPGSRGFPAEGNGNPSSTAIINVTDFIKFISCLFLLKIVDELMCNNC